MTASVNGERIVPQDWVRRSRGNDKPQLAVGSLGPSGYAHYGYANQWWTLGGDTFTGLGVHGQYLFVDPEAEVVIVKCSAWPTQDDPRRDAETVAALRRVAGHFAGPLATPVPPFVGPGLPMARSGARFCAPFPPKGICR